MCITTNAFAIDRIVQENGPTGTFSTITAAITAAVDGDRIIIYPKIGDNPYVEDITINKTLEFASAEDSVRYKIQGNITIQALNDRVVTIISAHLTAGSIIGNTAGWRTEVNVMGCILDGGSIAFTNQYYASIVSNILQSGNIRLSHGKVIGNDLNTSQILVEGPASINNDTLNIIANKAGRITCTSDIFLNIYNNFIRRLSTNSAAFAHSISYSIASSQVKMNIINNTVITPYSDTSNAARASYLSLTAPALIKNNIFQASAISNTLIAPNAILVAGNASSYNFISTSLAGYGAISTTDTSIAGSPANATTGQLILPTPALDGADPGFEYYDLNLSVGDAGCYGGSYSLDNYFPITGSSRVYNIDMPFGITTTGAPLNIKADGFDR